MVTWPRRIHWLLPSIWRRTTIPPRPTAASGSASNCHHFFHRFAQAPRPERFIRPTKIPAGCGWSIRPPNCHRSFRSIHPTTEAPGPDDSPDGRNVPFVRHSCSSISAGCKVIHQLSAFSPALGTSKVKRCPRYGSNFNFTCEIQSKLS